MPIAPNPFLGVVLHALGGFAAGSFYIPFKKVRKWAWESYWLVGGFFSWIIAPWVVAYLVCPDVMAILKNSPGKALFWAYAFGVLWGIGGLTFGLTMRYLGMSLGYALALGFCAAFGTIIPPVFKGEIGGMVASLSGLITLGGVAVCLSGIAVCGKAGVSKERELTTDQKKAAVTEFDFVKGIWIAVFAGIMSACMAFAIQAGKPIARMAVEHGTPALWQNSPLFIVIFAGGFTTNFLWCMALNIRNRSAVNYISGAGASQLANYLFCALAGVMWYMQFMFYGMGTTRMGRYDFSSWTIHMAFIIVFSNLWGLLFREWKGSSRRTHNIIFAGILVLIASTLVVGLGNYIASKGH
jgi:L-rhamnose-H+ transport protein